MGAIVWVMNGCGTLRVEHVQCAISVRRATSILNAQVSFFSERSLKVRRWSSDWYMTVDLTVAPFDGERTSGAEWP